MNKRFQNFLSLFTAVGTLCLFSHYVNASGRGANDATDYCGTSHVPELPAKAYGDLPKGYQYFDVPGSGMCGYYAIFLSFEAATKIEASHIELIGRNVVDRIGKFSAYIAHLRGRDQLPLRVREAFEALAWEVAFYVQKDAFDLGEDDWKRFLDALAGGGVPLDAALLQFLAWWLRCDIIVMRGDGQEENYSGVSPEEAKIKKEDSKKEAQHSEQKDRVLILEEVLKNSEKSKSIEKNDDTKDSKISEDSDTSGSSEEESEEESEDTDESDDSERGDQSPKCAIRVFYAQNGDKGHYWAVIPDQFHEIDEDKDSMSSGRISLWRTVKKSCH